MFECHFCNLIVLEDACPVCDRDEYESDKFRFEENYAYADLNYMEQQERRKNKQKKRKELEESYHD